MLTMDDLNPLLRRRTTVVTGQGEKVGTLGAVYLDDADERPTWVTVHTGLFGTRESFVPLDGAVVQGRDLVIRHERDLVTHAPSVDRDGQLSPGEEAALYRHYGIRATAPSVPSPAEMSTESSPVEVPTPSSRTEVPLASAPTAPPVAPSPTAPPVASPVEASIPSPVEALTPSSPAVVSTSSSSTMTPDIERSDAQDALEAPDAPTESDKMPRDGSGTPWVVRSEEKLLVGTERYEAGRARLRKYVVTEEASVSVPLVTETVRVDVEPITSSTPPGSGTPFQEEAVELTAREEIAVVETETVAVERVRMRRVEVTGRSTVRAEVRKERVAVTVDGADVADGIEDDARSAGRRPRKARSSAQGLAAARAGTPDASSIPTKGTNALLKGGKKRR